MTAQRSLLFLSLLLAGCSGKPDLPTRDRAIEIYKGYHGCAGNNVCAFDKIECEYRDPDKNAQTGEWMAFCTYNVTQTFTAYVGATPRIKKKQNTIRVFWRENFGPDGKNLWM